MAATILLADGDPINRMNWKALLRDQGYWVIAFGTGKAVLESCPRLQPDLALINTALPDIPGFEVCRLLKTDPRNRSTPVFMITTLSDASDALQASEAGADDCWGGTPSRWEVLNRLRSLLQVKSYIDDQGLSVITSLAQSIESRDACAKGHGARVSILAMQLGRCVGIRERELDALYVGALIHDIGKVSIPDHILLKPGRLNFEEYRILKQHPAMGEQICAPLKSLRDALPVIRHHHERMDGSGYPDGLRGNSIPIGARVLQIADIYDALTNDRAYRKAVAMPTALTILSQEVGRGWLDAGLVTQFTSLVVAGQTSDALARWTRSQNSQPRPSLTGAVVRAVQQRG